MAGVEQWLRELPPVTRAYMLGALATTFLCATDLVSPFSLYFSFHLVFYRMQVWRLLTNFLFFGPEFNIDFFFIMFFLVRYSRALEEGSFRNRTRSYLAMLGFGAAIMLALAPALHLNFLGSPLTFMMVYVWARRNPFGHMNLLGVFNFTAPWLPWVLVAIHTLLGGSSLMNLVGIFAGHCYYFIADVYPAIAAARRNRRPLAARAAPAHEHQD